MMSRRVYFDNAATTPLRSEVLEAMLPYFTENYGNPSSIHQEGRKTRAAIESARKTVANLMNASTGEIFFTSGGTESNNMAIKCAVRDLGVKRIITSPVEHHCVKHSVEHLQSLGSVTVDFVRIDRYGLPDMSHLEELLGSSEVPTLVTLMHANNEIGSILDLAAVSALCKQHGAFLHSDTVQTVGHYPMDVQEIPIDFISGAAHKFFGPKGVGFIYINNRCDLHPYIDGGSQERNMRAGTENIAGIVGLAKALELATEDFEKDIAHITELKDYLKAKLLEICPDVEFNGHPENSLYSVLSVSFPPGPHAELMIMSLDIAGISVSGGSACSSGAESQSHVMNAIGHAPDRKSVRFSLCRANTKEEVDFTIEQLAAILSSGVQVPS